MASVSYGTTQLAKKLQVIEVSKMGREIEQIFGEIIIKYFLNLLKLQTHRTKKISETQAYEI